MDFFLGLDRILQIILIILVLLVISNLILYIKLIMVSARLNKFTRGGNIVDFEKVIDRYISEAELLKSNVNNNSNQIDHIFNKISTLKGKVEIMRYNAFGEEGQDLSYSIAFLDEKNNGVVISSIYNRGESSTYAKPIINGESTYKLSREELAVIERAMKN